MIPAPTDGSADAANDKERNALPVVHFPLGKMFIARHQAGEWGDLDSADIVENEYSLNRGLRLLSAYTLLDGTRIWIITEADRSSTCILLPEEY